jgi:hypothetical protein
MSAPNTIENLTPELRETAIMIQKAFPTGVPEMAYQPLLALLYEGMSFRAIAQVVAYCTGKTYPIVYNDVLGAVALADVNGLDAKALADVKQSLRMQGYDDWLANAE